MARTARWDVLRVNRVPYIEENPPGFTGHMASWGNDFSRTYGDCLVRFMRSPVIAGEYRCSGPGR
jgi:hypothetical protein